jgi:ABC-type nitrate/sulfonate/bicarbonate transport system permease component
MTERLKWLAISLVITCAVLGFWQLITDLRWISPIFLPSPLKAGEAMIVNFRSGGLAFRILLTLEHIFYGWLLASIVGIGLGAAIGISRAVRSYVQPTLEFFRPLPPSAMFPIAIPLFGLTEGMMLSVIAFGALWPTLLATVNGFVTVNPRLSEVSRLIGLSRRKYITSVALPNATPEVLAGMRLSLTIALLLSVLGEMLSGSDGLGRWILLQARAFRTPDLFAGVLLFGLIGYFSTQLLAAAERYLLRWRPAVVA